jgi:hypothetical protein
VLQKYATNDSATHYGFALLEDLQRLELQRIASYCKKNPLFDNILQEFLVELEKELKPLSS